MIKRAIVTLVVVVAVAAGVWQYRKVYLERLQAPAQPDAASSRGDGWLDRLYSQNPREVEAASREVTALGAAALPVIQSTLRDPQSEAERLKAALKACTILGKIAAPAIPDVASVLDEPGLTAEAALALSHLGAGALAPLRDALSEDDPLVRREALRSIGKLKERAPLDAARVVPLLIESLGADADEGVRAVAATYLGIIHERDAEAVPALIAALTDRDPEVRRAAAGALASFGPSAAPALPALRKAANDPNQDVAREAGQAVVKLQQK